jgi:hypothetical protein
MIKFTYYISLVVSVLLMLPLIIIVVLGSLSTMAMFVWLSISSWQWIFDYYYAYSSDLSPDPLMYLIAFTDIVLFAFVGYKISCNLWKL